MKGLKILMLPLLAISFAVFAPTLHAQASPLVTLPADDVAQLRRLAADRDFQKTRAEQAEQQRDEAIKSRDSWKGLYESEKVRADNIQGERIKILTDQSIADRQKIGELNAQVISLKSSRKWWFGVGAVAGGFAGYYVGKNRDRAIQLINPTAQPSAFNFGTNIKF